MVSFEDLFSVNTSSDCSTTVTSHHTGSVRSYLSSLDSPTRSLGMVNNNNNIHNHNRKFKDTTNYWKGQEVLQHDLLQERQLSHVVSNPIRTRHERAIRVSPNRQKIRHINHAEGLTC